MTRTNETNSMNNHLSVTQGDEEVQINCGLCLSRESIQRNKRGILQLEMQLKKISISIARLENDYAIPNSDPDPAQGSGTSLVRDQSPPPPTFAAPGAFVDPAGATAHTAPQTLVESPHAPVAPVRHRRRRRYENVPNGRHSKIPVKIPEPAQRLDPKPSPRPDCGPETGAIKKLLKIVPLNQLSMTCLIPKPKKAKSDIEKFNEFNEKMSKN